MNHILNIVEKMFVDDSLIPKKHFHLNRELLCAINHDVRLQVNLFKLIIYWNPITLLETHHNFLLYHKLLSKVTFYAHFSNYTCVMFGNLNIELPDKTLSYFTFRNAITWHLVNLKLYLALTSYHVLR